MILHIIITLLHGALPNTNDQEYDLHRSKHRCGQSSILRSCRIRLWSTTVFDGTITDLLISWLSTPFDGFLHRVIWFLSPISCCYSVGIHCIWCYHAFIIGNQIDRDTTRGNRRCQAQWPLWCSHMLPRCGSSSICHQRRGVYYPLTQIPLSPMVYSTHALSLYVMSITHRRSATSWASGSAQCRCERFPVFIECVLDRNDLFLGYRLSQHFKFRVMPRHYCNTTRYIIENRSVSYILVLSKTGSGANFMYFHPTANVQHKTDNVLFWPKTSRQNDSETWSLYINVNTSLFGWHRNG